MTENISVQPDGLYIVAQTTLRQLAEHELSGQFAGGLIPRALLEPNLVDLASLTLAEILHQQELSKISALLTALLALDAEIQTIVDDDKRVFPIPAFLSYRSRLSLDRAPLYALRLPPLNPDGHYLFSLIAEDHYLVVRMDIHPVLKVAGHVRIALSSPNRLPQRLSTIENRLDRQVLEASRIQVAVEEGSRALEESLTEVERVELITILNWLMQE